MVRLQFRIPYTVYTLYSTPIHAYVFQKDRTTCSYWNLGSQESPRSNICSPNHEQERTTCWLNVQDWLPATPAFADLHHPAHIVRTGMIRAINAV